MTQAHVGPLRIGLSARLMHQPPAVLGFRDKVLQYLEQSIAHWIMGRGALVFMLPTLGFDAEIERRKVSVHHYVQVLDALVLQGGADVAPASYGQAALEPAWRGDGVRDRYEIELLEGFLSQGKPVLGICRGHQLINVAFGGSLLQDIRTLRPDALAHLNPELYDRHRHRLRIDADSWLAPAYAGHLDEQGRGWVNSIHHQAVDRLGADLVVAAYCDEDGIVEAIRARGRSFVAGVQWHPEFHGNDASLLSGEPLLDAFLDAAAMTRG